MKKEDISEALLEKIRNTDIQTLHSGKDDDGVSFLSKIFKIHFALFGETCSFCPAKIAGYIQKIKNYNSQDMKNSNKTLSDYQLQEGVILPIAGTSEAYSNANITNEIAVKILAVNANRKSLFVKMPKDVDKQVELYKSQLTKESESNEKVAFGDLLLTIEDSVAFLGSIGVKTKASTAAGIEKAMKDLKKDQMKTINDDAANFMIEKNTIKEQIPFLNEEQLQFNLDAAQQEFDDAEEADKASAKEALDVAVSALAAFKK